MFASLRQLSSKTSVLYLTDTALCLGAALFSIGIKYSFLFQAHNHSIYWVFTCAFVITFVQLFSFWAFGVYKVTTSTVHQLRAVKALVFSGLSVGVLSILFRFYTGISHLYVPASLLLVNFFIASFLFRGSRFVFKYLNEYQEVPKLVVSGAIQQVRLEQLLGREPIQLHDGNISEQIEGKTILITGAAGSIGSEIVRQVFRYKPQLVVMLDQAESALHDLEFELIRNNSYPLPTTRFKIILANVTDEVRMKKIFQEVRPNWVFHAAAYKHVPMMEYHPYEAAKVNILGTKLVADLSVKYKVEKFVMVSTDKAVNPTNVMGATKRFAEMYTQSLNTERSHTKFIITRFGNVLGSNGSVIPLFRKQIESGGPITVTHPEITRYFMTIPEACQLVLEAGTMGNGGEIFVFDMGRPIKIVDLARKMIRLSGLVEEEDIKIVFSGLRPGEKLYEELLNNNENTLPTHHSKILLAKIPRTDDLLMRKHIFELTHILAEENDLILVDFLKMAVPEYVSVSY